MGVHESVKTFNATVRTMLATVVVAAAGFVGYEAYDIYNKPALQLRQKEKLLREANADLATARQEVEQQSKEIDRLQTSLSLLKVEQRVAELRILSQQPGEGDSQPPITTVEFVETDPEGKPIGEPQQFRVPGEQVYVEYLVVKFDDKYIEQADLERGTAICLFQRLFGSAQKPEEGFTLDNPNTRPTAYARGERMSEFEENIWADFWDLAHSPQRLEQMGIRSAMADAPSIKARPGARYRIEIRTTGGFQLRTVDE